MKRAWKVGSDRRPRSPETLLDAALAKGMSPGLQSGERSKAALSCCPEGGGHE